MRNRRLEELERRRQRVENFRRGGLLYRTLVSIAIVGVFLAAGIIVLGTTGTFKLSAGLFGTAAMIGILCLGILSALPWVKKIEENKYKMVAFVFIGLIAACMVLWIISDWLIVSIVNRGAAGEDIENTAYALLWFIKIAIILSLQLMLANVVAMLVLKYRNTMIAFQVITYASYAFIDFYLTFLFMCIRLFRNSSGEPDVALSESFGILGSQPMVTLLILAIVYAAISSSIVKSVEARRLRRMTNDYYNGRDLDETNPINNEEPKEEPKVETTEEKLAKLKKLYEQELISKEEYEQKRADLLKDL